MANALGSVGYKGVTLLKNAKNYAKDKAIVGITKIAFGVKATDMNNFLNKRRQEQIDQNRLTTKKHWKFGGNLKKTKTRNIKTSKRTANHKPRKRNKL